MKIQKLNDLLKIGKLKIENYDMFKKFLSNFKVQISNLIKLFSVDEKKRSTKYVMLTVLIVLLVIIFIFFLNTVNNYQITSALSDSQTFSYNQALKNKDLVALDDLIGLPQDQKGKFGTIKNLEALAKKRDFFAKAKEGDILAIYPDMTIIYDPVNKTVIDIAMTKLLK